MAKYMYAFASHKAVDVMRENALLDRRWLGGIDKQKIYHVHVRHANAREARCRHE